MTYEMLCQAFSLYEHSICDLTIQLNCIAAFVGTLLACASLPETEYEVLITKTAQLSAKLLQKPDQCRMVARCSHLFFPTDSGENARYRNAQRSLECLQRSLKLADTCIAENPSRVGLLVDLLEDYLFLFERGCPTISPAYITGLVSLSKEHLNNSNASSGVVEARKHYRRLVRRIQRKKEATTTSSLFADVQIDNIAV